MNVLIACEESQAVCKEFRKKGHMTFSCDIQKCSGDKPEWHIKGNVLKLLNGNCVFKTQNGDVHILTDKWDLIIAFPPCTHLAVSGARHFDKKRLNGMQYQAIKFFEQILESDCDKICVENPVNIIGSDYIKNWFPQFAHLPNCTQYIQPYWFGDNARKKTGLWLKNLEKLEPSNIVEPDIVTYISKDGKKKTFSKDYGYGGGNNGKRRSKTYPGVARAMAEKWG